MMNSATSHQRINMDEDENYMLHALEIAKWKMESDA